MLMFWIPVQLMSDFLHLGCNRSKNTEGPISLESRNVLLVEKLVHPRKISSANTALTIETIILSKWRKQSGAPPAISPSDMPQGGASETAALIHVDIEDTAMYSDQLVFEHESQRIDD